MVRWGYARPESRRGWEISGCGDLNAPGRLPARGAQKAQPSSRNRFLQIALGWGGENEEDGAKGGARVLPSPGVGLGLTAPIGRRGATKVF